MAHLQSEREVLRGPLRGLLVGKSGSPAMRQQSAECLVVEVEMKKFGQEVGNRLHHCTATVRKKRLGLEEGQPGNESTDA